MCVLIFVFCDRHKKISMVIASYVQGVFQLEVLIQLLHTAGLVTEHFRTV